MRVIGLVWEGLRKQWYRNGKAFTLEELSLNLKTIVSKQRSRFIPTKSPVLLPVWKALTQIGTQAPDIVAIFVDSLETSDEFEQQSRRTSLEREEVGVVNIDSNMQSTSAPAWKTSGRFPPVFFRWWSNWASLEPRGGNTNTTCDKHFKEARSTSVLQGQQCCHDPLGQK